MASTRIDEVIVRHHPRLRGKSKYGISRTGRVLLDAMTVKMLQSCARRPLHWFGYWAVTAFLLAAVTGVWALILALQPTGEPQYVVPGITIVLGYLGVHLVFSGVFGEIAVYSERKDRVKALVDVTFLGSR